SSRSPPSATAGCSRPHRCPPSPGARRGAPPASALRRRGRRRRRPRSGLLRRAAWRRGARDRAASSWRLGYQGRPVVRPWADQAPGRHDGTLESPPMLPALAPEVSAARFAGARLLYLMPHADDELFAAGLLLANARAPQSVVWLTLGGLLPQLRRGERRRSGTLLSRRLGVESHPLGFRDGALASQATQAVDAVGSLAAAAT